MALQGSKRTTTKAGRADNGLPALIDSANDDLSRSRLELYFFLGLIAFIIVTTLSITDKDLLVGARVKVPILELTMSLDAFLLGAPLTLLAIHFALLIKFDRLQEKCREINERIELVSYGRAGNASDYRLRVTSSFLTQWLVGRGNRFDRLLSGSIYVICFFIAPLATLGIITVRTLPLHNYVLTATQNLIIFADAWLLFYFRPNMTKRSIRSLIYASGTWFSVSLVLCIPDSRFDDIGRAIWPVRVPFDVTETDALQRFAFGPTAFLLENRLDETTKRPVLLFSRNLVVMDERMVSGGGTGSEGISLRGRDLSYALLAGSDLRDIDFTLADLTGANLERADLRGSKFGCIPYKEEPLMTLWRRLVRDRIDRTAGRNWGSTGFGDTGEGGWITTSFTDYYAPLICSNLYHVNFDRADMRSADFGQGHAKPSLFGTRLREARLDGVDFSMIDLGNADLVGASLAGVNLSGANLVGANLAQANLTAANLSNADLGLAVLLSSILDGANLREARLIATNLAYASLIGTDLTNAIVTAASFKHAKVWLSAPPPKKNLSWADLTNLNIEKPNEAELSRIKKSVDQLQGLSRQPAGSRLVKVLELESEKFSDKKLENEVWANWARLLVRSKDESEYRNAYSKILIDAACSQLAYAMAIERWAQPFWGYYDTYFRSDPLPQPPPDAAIEQLDEILPSSDVLYPDSINYHPDNPIPDWVDFAPLVTRFREGNCRASKELSAKFIEKLEDTVARRALRANHSNPSRPTSK